MKRLLGLLLLLAPAPAFSAGQSSVVTDVVQQLADFTGPLTINADPVSFTGIVNLSSTVATSTVTANAPILGDGSNGDPLRLDTSSVTLLGPTIDASELPAGGYDSTYVNETGDTMSGNLTFSSNAGLRMDPSGTAPSHATGAVFYDSNESALAYYTDSMNFQVTIGRDNYVKARNVSGSTILRGEAVYVSGGSGGNVEVRKAQSNSLATTNALGVATENINDNANGYILSKGFLNNFDTSAFSEGAILYVSSTTAGGLTQTAPKAPNYRQGIAVVARSHASQGSLGIAPTNLAPVGFGSGDQLLGVNSTGATPEYKTLQNTDGFIGVTNAAGSITLNLADSGQSIKRRTAAQLRTQSCASHPSQPCVRLNSTDFDLYTSTGSSTGQWRNTRLGTGP